MYHPERFPVGSAQHRGGKHPPQLNPNGRNLRTVWDIATAPFPQAHFATFPPAIPERCIKAGTSEHGCCPQCGAPWKRVVEKIASTAKGRGTDGTSNARGNDRDIHNGVDWYRNANQVTTTGWQPTCTCGFYVCPTSCFVIESFKEVGSSVIQRKEYEDLSGVRERILSQANEPEMLRSFMCREVKADIPREDLSSMQREIHPIKERPNLLQTGVLCEGFSQTTRPGMFMVSQDIQADKSPDEVLRESVFTEMVCQEQKNNQGVDNDIEGLCINPGPRPPQCKQNGLCDGASPCNGESSGAAFGTGGSCPSQEQNQKRQQTGKLGGNEGKRTQQEEWSQMDSTLPPLPPGVSIKGECKKCGAPLIHIPYKPQPSTVLDVFSGAGTTALVAAKLQRNAIGIELNPEYVEMSRTRIMGELGMLCEVEVK